MDVREKLAQRNGARFYHGLELALDPLLDDIEQILVVTFVLEKLEHLQYPINQFSGQFHLPLLPAHIPVESVNYHQKLHLLLVLLQMQIGGGLHMAEFLYPLGEVERVVFYDGVEVVNGKHRPFWNLLYFRNKI